MHGYLYIYIDIDIYIYIYSPNCMFIIRSTTCRDGRTKDVGTNDVFWDSPKPPVEINSNLILDVGHS